MCTYNKAATPQILMKEDSDASGTYLHDGFLKIHRGHFADFFRHGYAVDNSLDQADIQKAGPQWMSETLIL